MLHEFRFKFRLTPVTSAARLQHGHNHIPRCPPPFGKIARPSPQFGVLASYIITQSIMRGRVAEFVHEYERESIANTFNISLGGRRVGKVAEALAASTWPRRVICAAQARRAPREDGEVSGVRPWVLVLGSLFGSWTKAKEYRELAVVEGGVGKCGVLRENFFC